MLQKELQVNNLERKLLESEGRVAKEASDVVGLQRQVRELENKLKEAQIYADDAKMQAQEQVERTRREFELSESRYRQTHQSEKEGMMKEYENMVQKVREEYQLCNDTLRKASDSQINEITALSTLLRDSEERFRKDKSELDEQLIKDKYTLDVLHSENHSLQDAKLLLEQEREQLYTQVQTQEGDLSAQRVEIRELKTQVKKLNQVLYGRR
ncbi:hypothetical protein FGO68_gene16225 [Halteria grandinella]|uniref:Uncharacterized protein n=1 Tax=Halteria grandinella TaxID=5974 RepID=A0A8J8T391_HALGN|nr:hypothetical protein FGO68_gene16225 [Halteria grandinella]